MENFRDKVKPQVSKAAKLIALLGLLKETHNVDFAQIPRAIHKQLLLHSRPFLRTYTV